MVTEDKVHEIVVGYMPKNSRRLAGQPHVHPPPAGAAHNRLHTVSDALDHTGSISSAQHGSIGSGDLHPEYAEVADAETITGAWTYTRLIKGNPAAATVATITAISATNPTEITTAAVHGLNVGDVVLISHSNATPTVEGIRTVLSVPSTTKFTIDVNVTGAGTRGFVIVGLIGASVVGSQTHPAFVAGYDRVSFGIGTQAPNMHMRRATGLSAGIPANAGWEFVRSSFTHSRLIGVKSATATGIPEAEPDWVYGTEDEGSSTPGFGLGAGGANAIDTKVGRVAAGILGITDALKIRGTGGAGFIELAGQIPEPSAPASGVRVYGTERGLSFVMSTLQVVGPLGQLGATIFNGRPTPLGGFAVSRGAVVGIDGWGSMAQMTKVLSGGTERTLLQASPICTCLYEQTTPATINSDVGYEGAINIVFGGENSLMWSIQLPAITDIRVFVGWTDQTLATMLGSDNPAGNYVGMQFSTSRGDTNLQWVYKDGTTQTLVDSLLAPPTSAPIDPRGLRLREIGSGAVEFAILGDVGEVMSASALISAGMPAIGTEFRVVAGLRNLAASTKSLAHYGGFQQVFSN